MCFWIFSLTWWVTALVGCHREFCWVLKHFWSWNWYRRWQKEELQVIFCQNDWFFYQINQLMITDFVWRRDLSILGMPLCQEVGVRKILTFINYNFNQLVNSSERAIFQTFWRLHCCAKFLFFELETSKLWLLAPFLIYFNCAKFQQDWTTLILNIL